MTSVNQEENFMVVKYLATGDYEEGIPNSSLANDVLLVSIMGLCGEDEKTFLHLTGLLYNNRSV